MKRHPGQRDKGDVVQLLVSTGNSFVLHHKKVLKNDKSKRSHEGRDFHIVKSKLN